MTRLEPAQSALWIVRAPDQPDPEHWQRLSASERAQASRYRDAARQARYVTGRALLRHLLGTLLGLPAESVPIVLGDRRRPRLALPDPGPETGIDFNLSSTEGLVACAIGRQVRLGIDVERPGRVLEFDALAKRLFSEAERRWWEQSEDREAAFFRLWTLKESVAKADGEGLGIPFGALTVLPDDQGGIRVDLTAIGTDARRWRILSLDSEVPAAIAIRYSEKPGTIDNGGIDLAPELPAEYGFDRVAVQLHATHEPGTAAR